MRSLPTLNLLLFSSVACLSGFAAFPTSSFADDDVKAIVTGGEFFGQARYRYEFVDQDGIDNRANASSMRLNLGFKTGKYMDFQALLEGQLVQTLGPRHFNDTVNGRTGYPVVADPSDEEINQAWLSWSGVPGLEVKAGRQIINLDNQRFLGSVDWRQNDQTFDSVVFAYSGLDKATFHYGYVWNVNRVFGDDHPLGNLDTDTHVLRAGYQWAEWLNAAAYGYWIDIDRASSLSSKTFGLRATGKVPLNADWTFSYEAEVAHQSDHGNNSADYDEAYYHIAPSLSGHGFTLTAGYEVLGGDGSNAFQTPLATLHKFNGWADKFLSTPARGLEDAYVQASYSFSDVSPLLNGTTVTAVYHDFSGDESGDFGSEIDLSVGRSFKLPEGQPFEKLNVLIKYSDYEAEDAPYTDTQKAWLQLGVAF